MNHEEVRSRFSELLDGELPEEEARVIHGHLEECEECRKAWDEFRVAFESLRSVVMTEAPPYLAERIKRRIHRRSRGRFFGEAPPIMYRVPYEIFSLIIILIALIMFMLLSGLNMVAEETISEDAEADRVEEIEQEGK
jgi:predicted anti-sigma-YlaC factor YlaD